MKRRPGSVVEVVKLAVEHEEAYTETTANPQPSDHLISLHLPPLLAGNKRQSQPTRLEPSYLPRPVLIQFASGKES